MIRLTDVRVVAVAEKLAVKCGCRNTRYHAPVARAIIEADDEKARLTTTTARL